MTQISSIYDLLVTRLTTLYPSHKRLPHAYQIGQNPDTYLDKGWALAVRDGVNSNRIVGCNLSVVRNFSVVLTRKFKSRELDPAKKSDTEKDLLEDLQILMDSLESNTVLDVSLGTHLVKYLGDSGIIQVREDQDSYLSIVVETSVEYFRPLS